MGADPRRSRTVSGSLWFVAPRQPLSAWHVVLPLAPLLSALVRARRPAARWGPSFWWALLSPLVNAKMRFAGKNAPYYRRFTCTAVRTCSGVVLPGLTLLSCHGFRPERSGGVWFAFFMRGRIVLLTLQKPDSYPPFRDVSQSLRRAEIERSEQSAQNKQGTSALIPALV